MRPQREVRQGYDTIGTVQNTNSEGILNVSWDGETCEPHLKAWESEWHRNLKNHVGEQGEGIIFPP